MSFRLPNPAIFVLAGLVLVVALTVVQQHRGQFQLTQPASIAQPTAGVAAGANGTVQPPPPGSPAPADIFQRAIALLQSRQSVSARVRQTSEIFGRRPVGSGIYLEQRLPGVTLFRLEMRLQLDDQPSSLLEVCDGHYVWNYRQIFQQETLVRIDLDRVNRHLEEAGKWQPGSMGGLPAIGGLPRLVQALGSNFSFTRADQKVLRGQVPAWRLEGLWTPARLEQLLPEQAKSIQGGKAPNLSILPSHAPDRVVVFLGMDDLFPYRIEYRRQPDKKESPEATSDKMMTEIDFYDVAFDVPIPPIRFLYNPPKNLTQTDETDKFLNAIGLK
jgi:outer membrane lipoprotein-sorting protein